MVSATSSSNSEIINTKKTKSIKIDFAACMIASLSEQRDWIAL